MKNHAFRAIFITIAVITTTACSSIPPGELEKKYATGNSKFIEVDGMRVHYRDEGSGPVVIMIHGIVSSLHTWDAWADEMKGKFRVIRFDVPGFGLTGPANFKYKPGFFVRFLHGFVKKMELKKFSLIGNSLGGFISWKYAAGHPEQVEKLVLLDPVGYSQKTPWIIGMMALPVIGNIATVITPRLIVEMNVKEVYGDPKRIKPEAMDRYYSLIMREGNREALRDIFIELEEQAGDPTISDEIPDIKVPTMVIWGDKDIWTPYAYIESWKKDLPSAKYVVYEGVGHVPMEEIPEQSVKDCEAFLLGG